MTPVLPKSKQGTVITSKTILYFPKGSFLTLFNDSIGISLIIMYEATKGMYNQT